MAPNTQIIQKDATIVHAGGDVFQDAVQWTTAYPFLSAQDDLEIVSDSANDSAAGTGVRTVELTLLQLGATEVQWQYYSHTIVVTMNGLTPVTVPDPPTGTGGQWIRCNRIKNDTVGDLATNDGIITLSAINGVQEKLGEIAAGETVDLQCVYTVPSDEFTIVVGASVSLDDAKQNDDGRGQLFERAPGKAFTSFGRSNKVDNTRTLDELPVGDFGFAAGTDLIWRVKSSAADSDIHCRFAVARLQRERVATFGADRNL